MKWLNLADEGVELQDKFWELKAGTTIGFVKDGQIRRFKIMRVDRPCNGFWVKKVKLWQPDDFSKFWDEERKRRAK